MGMWKYFAPDISCAAITDISLDELKKRGIKGLLFDLDNTITEWHKEEVPETTKQWLHNLKEQGFCACIVSNNHGPRVKKVSGQLGLPCFYSAAKPRRKSYRQAAALLELPPQQLAMVGDQLLTDVLGGNRSGLTTIFVKYIHPKEHWGTTHIFRPLERWLMKRLANEAK
ncbi:MAG: YqeG family HAD IIIA-type phosphatase [Clostridiales bacterium]|nr:YqeG family HAD IIIA-type phosphatase [Clostridiales bacterium]